MSRRVIDLRGAEVPLLAIGSYARGGPGRRGPLSPAEVALIARTVARTPEAMVKVLPAGTSTRAAVKKHVDYVSREGEVALETDDGQRLQGADVGRRLLEDWDLDLEEQRPRSRLSSREGRAAPRLVYKLVFSMPEGTAPEKVLKATEAFCREQFALKRRYALALHTDEPHPHVHVILKAVSEQGRRLNLKKAHLRQWRAEFAQHLRAVGVAANATTRFVRGETKSRKSDGIYRAARRGHSTHYRERMDAVAAELSRGEQRTESGKAKLMATRRALEDGWGDVVLLLEGQGERALAAETRRFVMRLPRARTEKEQIREELLGHVRVLRPREQAMTR